MNRFRWYESRPDAPPDLQEVVRRALVKDLKQRTITADEIARTLAPESQRHAVTPAGWRTGRVGKALIAASVVATLSVLGIAGWQVKRSREVTWATQVAAPEARRLLEADRSFEAFEMRMRSARAIAPEESVLTTAWAEISRPLSVTTTPEGADIAIARLRSRNPELDFYWGQPVIERSCSTWSSAAARTEGGLCSGRGRVTGPVEYGY